MLGNKRQTSGERCAGQSETATAAAAAAAAAEAMCSKHRIIAVLQPTLLFETFAASRRRRTTYTRRYCTKLENRRVAAMLLCSLQSTRARLQTINKQRHNYFCAFVIFTALHAMQTLPSDENSIRLSICQTRNL